ncbi:hypothetical protein ACBJ59_30320 [Nonomuraea sp. MTCD27]|uniref:hypothetical protein n=1 Tax=Nonomuraea sp. MTCD27 TaxID=1676747 RepID=UPI0035BEEC9C
MALPLFGVSTGNRPSGLVPPYVDLSGWTELRVHGVGGSTPQNLLGDLAPQQVWGDRLAGFYRTADTAGRHVEGYSWGGLTSRSGARVLWLLLLPFTLANLAGWMWPFAVQRTPRGFRAFRLLVRMAALALTLNVVLLVGALAMDYAAYQCAGDVRCLDPWWPDLLPTAAVTSHPGRRLLVGALVPLLAIALLAWLSQRSQSRYEAVPPPGTPDPPPPCDHSAAGLPAGLLDPDFWNTAPYVRVLGRIHVAAAVALLAILLTHTVRSAVPASPSMAGLLILALAGAILTGAVVALVPERAGPVLLKLGSVLEYGSLLAVTLAGVFAWLTPGAAAAPPQELPGLGEIMSWVYGGTALTLLLVLACLVAGAVSRSVSSQGPRRAFRWGAPFVLLVLAIGLTNAVMIGLIINVADAFGEIRYASRTAADGSEPVIVIFPGFRDLAVQLNLVPVALAVLFAGWQAARWRAGRRESAAMVAAEYREMDMPVPVTADIWSVSAADGPSPSPLPDVATWSRRVARARRFAGLPLQVDLLLSAIVLVGLLVLLLPGWGLRAVDANGTAGWVVGTATVLAPLLPLVILMLVRASWKDSSTRHNVGVLWDIGTFWPRGYHPLAPPSYAERAVPELQRRMWFLHDRGARILLVGHSQGAVLAAAALAQRGSVRPPDLRVTLVTCGSPLRKLYGWGFPAYFTEELAAALNSAEHVALWRNYHYPTDWAGGPCAAGTNPAVDRPLPDPPTCRFLYGDTPPQIGGHSGYWRDPAMWQEIDSLLSPPAERPSTGPRPPPSSLQPSLQSPSRPAEALSPVRGTTPVSRGDALVRLTDLETRTGWLEQRSGHGSAQVYVVVRAHLEAARRALDHRSGRDLRAHPGQAQRVVEHLDEAETTLLLIAPTDYVRGQMPQVLTYVRRLPLGDPRRLAAERIDAGLGGRDLTDVDRTVLMAAVRAATLRAGQGRLRAGDLFRQFVVVAVVLASLLAGLAIFCAAFPGALPPCFPAGDALACPTGVRPPGGGATPWDVPLVMALGVVGAAIGAAVSLRRLSALPASLTLLKLPLGGLLALVGLLALRGGLTLGLGSPSGPAQILAWAVLFGFAQQMITSPIDRNAQKALTEPDESGAIEVSSEALDSAVSSALHRALQPPRLINYRGVLSVWLESLGGAVLQPDDEGRFRLRPGGSYVVRARLGPAAAPRSLEASVVIEQGDPAERATFTVELVGMGVSGPAQRLDLVGADATATAGLPFEPPAEAGERVLWVRLAQQERLIQNVRVSWTVSP